MPGPNDTTDAAIEAIRTLPAGGVALLIGASDQGKTTLAARAARYLCERGERIAVVDSDIGTSEIGPPGVVGVGWAERDAERLHDLRPASQFFVGALTPRAAPLEWLAAAVAAIRWAQAAGASRIIVDTPGDVFGPGPRRLFSALALAGAPGAIIGLRPAGESLPVAEAAASVCGTAQGATYLPVDTSPDARRRSTPQRALLRQTRLSIVLDGGRELFLPIAGEQPGGASPGVRTIGTTLGTGKPVPPHLMRWIAETLRLAVAAVVRAEIAEDTLTVFVAADAPTLPESWATRGGGVVAAHFQVRQVRAIHLSALMGTCVGLIGDGGRLLSVGCFEGFAPDRDALCVYTALRSLSGSDDREVIARVRAVHFGRFRMGRDGTFQGDLRSGET